MRAPQRLLGLATTPGQPDAQYIEDRRGQRSRRSLWWRRHAYAQYLTYQQRLHV